MVIIALLVYTFHNWQDDVFFSWSYGGGWSTVALSVIAFVLIMADRWGCEEPTWQTTKLSCEQTALVQNSLCYSTKSQVHSNISTFWDASLCKFVGGLEKRNPLSPKWSTFKFSSCYYCIGEYCLCWWSTKFSQLVLKEMYGDQCREFGCWHIGAWRVKSLKGNFYYYYYVFAAVKQTFLHLTMALQCR